MEFTFLFLLGTAFFAAFEIAVVTTTPCWRKTFTSTSFVCLCNSTYCDTIEPETKLPNGQYVVYSSTKSGLRFNKTIHKLSQTQAKTRISIRIEPDKTKQTIIGFGGTFTDASGMNIASLPEGAQQNLINAYFGPEGIEYTLGRIPIASNDMSTDVYSYDFTSGDTYLSKFTIAGYDHLYKLPYIDKAVVASRRNISLFGSPWSSPAWMKTNDNMVGYGTVLPEMRKVYANYLGRFMREYESFMFHGKMWGLTTESSPSRGCDNSSEPVYQSMCWSADDMRNWVVKDLKPSLKDYGYGHIKLMVMDDNRGELPTWSSAFSDNVAKSAIDGFAVQWYNDSSVSPEVLSAAHAQFSGKFILGSEACIRNSKTIDLGSWERGEEMAKSIFQDLNNYVSGYTHYNLALDMSGGPSWISNFADSPVIVDSGNKVFYKQPLFYFLGHFSKFVTPGSLVLEWISDDVIAVPVVAFHRPDGAVVVIVANMSEGDTDLQIAYKGDFLRHTLEASSVHTFVMWDS